MKSGSSPGIDGITPDHLKSALNSPIVFHLCKLLTVCFRFGMVPTSFKKGILVSILKKPSLDPSIAKNYRPVIVSSVISKLAEMYILEECNDYNFSDYQFGFVKEISISLAHDVSMYCKDKKSPVFLCGLDAEGAFDGIPHPVLFNKCRHVVPDFCWKLLYNWYSDISVRIKWYREGRQSGYFLTSRDIFIVTVLNYRSLGENNLTADMAERDIN